MHKPFQLTDADVRQLGDGDLVEHDDFASDAEVRGWSAAMTSSDAAFTRSGTGATGRQDDRVRTDRTGWEADLPGVFPGLRERFVELRTELNQAAWLGLAVFTVQLAVYDPGGLYAAHHDATRGDAARRVTAILYLNPDWQQTDGGCLRVHAEGGHRDVQPRGGRLVVFRSDRLRHEVLPGSAVRHAATAWFRGRDRPA